jgi:hypothetical protein
MKKIFILSFFLSFANILLGQISLTVKRMQFVKENQLDWKKRKRSVKVLFNKKKSITNTRGLKKISFIRKCYRKFSKYFYSKKCFK